MDAGYINENGYVFVTARDDDVINVAGHRISTASLGNERLISSLYIRTFNKKIILEDAVLRHPDVADAAVFGVIRFFISFIHF